jgi:hypothetical protein
MTMTKPRKKSLARGRDAGARRRLSIRVAEYEHAINDPGFRARKDNTGMNKPGSMKKH